MTALTLSTNYNAYLRNNGVDINKQYGNYSPARPSRANTDREYNGCNNADDDAFPYEGEAFYYGE